MGDTDCHARRSRGRDGTLPARRGPAPTGVPFARQVRRRDGSVIWISENARAIRDEQGQALFFEGSVVDITAQVEAEQALRQSRALYRVLVENSRDGVFLVQRGKVVFANEAMAGILGYTEDEVVSTDLIIRGSTCRA